MRKKKKSSSISTHCREMAVEGGRSLSLSLSQFWLKRSHTNENGFFCANGPAPLLRCCVEVRIKHRRGVRDILRCKKPRLKRTGGREEKWTKR